ncbi:EAL domain-containing protein [Pseudokineococcus sp. 5B2Z-1]|uniref:EAL domain-containing protein n=1 Tax=Pseudokineococcus sp. 5B2Z-1 TaxID=3132744 RepID=UPI00309F5CE4
MDERPADEPSADEPSADEPSVDEPSVDERADRVQLVLDAFTAMAGEDDEEGALERAVDVARLATRSLLGAAVLVGPSGVTHLVHAGMTTSQVARLPGPPQGRGVLGAVLAGELVRTADLRTHPSAGSVPEGHVPMRAFLGVPVQVEEGAEVLGAFYLAKPPGHPPHTGADEALVTALARQCAQVVVRLRDARRVRELAARLEAAERVRAAALAQMTTDVDPVEAVDRLLEVAREQLRMPFAALVHVDEDAQVVERSSGEAPVPALRRDVALGGPSPCRRVLAEGRGVVADLVGDPSGREALAAPAGLAAYAGAPVLVRGRAHGTLCTASDRQVALTRSDASVLEVLADLAGRQLARLEDDDAVRTRREEALAPLLAPGGLRVVVQPVVDLVADRVVGVEALARFPGRGQGPDRVFAAAADVGLGTALELAAVDAATALLDRLPAHLHLAVNAGPALVTHPGLLERLAALPPGRVVVEVTEHEDLADHPGLPAALAALRAAGARVALDDVGAGYAGLRSVVDLSPDVIKADASLVRGLPESPARRSLVRALVALAADLGADLVAEGVETPAELAELRRLGVRLAQGFLLGRPAPLEELRLSRPRRAAPRPGPSAPR